MTLDATAGQNQPLEKESQDTAAENQDAIYADADLASPDNQTDYSKPDTASGLLNDVAIDDFGAVSPEPPKQLSDEAIETYAEDLYAAVHRTGFLWTADPDKDSVFSVLPTLNEADRKALESAYTQVEDNGSHVSIRDDFKRNLGNSDWRKAEALLNASDNRTNDAGNLMYSLAGLTDNRMDAERRVVETFATLNSDQMQLLESDFQKQYNMSVTQALKQFGISEDSMTVLATMRIPTDQRTAYQLASLADFAVDKHNLDYLSMALRGETPAAQEARKNLLSNQTFMDKIANEFGAPNGFYGNMAYYGVPGLPIYQANSLIEAVTAADEAAQDFMVAMDLLHLGQISLSTIAYNNTGSLFGWLDNPENIIHAVDGATDSERAAFNKGFALAQSGAEPSSEDDKAALDFYTRTHKAFEGIGDERQRALAEAKLAFGNEDLVTKILSGETAAQRFTTLEEMTSEDWMKLSDPSSGPALRTQIEALVGSFADESERSRFMQILNEKAQAGSFAESNDTRRTLTEVVEQNTDYGIFWNSYDANAISQALISMTPGQASEYQSNEGVRTQLASALAGLDENQKRYLQALLKQVEETGLPPIEGPAEKVLANAMNNADSATAVADIETLLQASPSLRVRFLADPSTLNSQELALKETIQNSIEQAMKDAGVIHSGRDYNDMQAKNAAFEDLFQDGILSVAAKAEMELKNPSFYEQAGKASKDERAKLFESGSVNEQERHLIEVIASQGGQSQLEDKLRAFLLTDGNNYEQFKSELEQLSSEGRLQLQEAFSAKYGAAFEGDFLARVSDADRNAYEGLLASGQSDGRQTYYDNLEIGLKSLSGMSADGSDLTLERTLSDNGALLQDFSARFEALPQEMQQKANQLFQEALQDYRESKEAFAEKLYQAAVIVGGVAVAVGTGGLALPALAAFAAISAAGRVALKSAIQGEDYDSSLGSVLQDLAIGGLTGGLSVLGPETIMALKGVGAATAGIFMKTGGEALAQGIRKGSEAYIEKQVNILAGRAMITGQPITKASIEALAQKVAAPGTDAATLIPILQATFAKAELQVADSVARTMMGSFTSGAREVGSWAALGGTTNVALQGGIDLSNGNLDFSTMPEAFVTGAVFGGGTAGAFKSLGLAAPVISRFRGASDLPNAKFTEANMGRDWTATLEDGTVLTKDTPGNWQAKLEDGSIVRREGNTLQRTFEDGSGFVNIFDKNGNARQFALAVDGIYIDPAGNKFSFYGNGEIPPASSSFKFQKKAPITVEKSTEPFDWTDWQGQPMRAEAGDLKVTQPNGQISSIKPEALNATYENIPGTDQWIKTAITNAQRLDADIAIPTLEGMGVGKKGDWMVTGGLGERYIVSAAEFNQLYKTVEAVNASPIFEFRKTSVIQAERLTEPKTWTTPNGSVMTADAGDVLVTQADGSVSSVKPEIFGKTYEEVPGRPGFYRKAAITRAQQLNEDTAINTLEGIGTGKKGDWLVTGPEGEQYIIGKDFFDANYAPVPITVDNPPQNFVKSMTIKAKLLTESGPWVNPDAPAGTPPMMVNAGDYLAMPKGQEPYVIPGDYFRANYVQLPGLDEYGRTTITVAQVLDKEAKAWSKSAGVTAGKPGDYLITRPDGGQEILSKQKFEEQFSPANLEQATIEPLSMPKPTGAEIVNGTQRIQPWANGEIVREGNSVTITDIPKGLERTYVNGRLTRESQTVLDGDTMRIVTRTYPYGDMTQVSELPTLDSYNKVLNENPRLRLAQELSDTKPSTALIDTPERISLRQKIQNLLWDSLNAKYKPEQGKTLHIVLGLSGSGKSTIAEAIAAKIRGIIMDADDVKPMFVDDWQDGIGAAALAKEANEIMNPLVAKSMERGDNIIIPAVGSSTTHLEALIQKAHDMGYTVDISLVDIPPTEAMKRIVGRLEKGGMYVDPRYLASLGNVPAQNFGKLVEKYFTNSDIVSSYQRINNLNSPTLVETGRKVGDYHNSGITPEFFTPAKVEASEVFPPVPPAAALK